MVIPGTYIEVRPEGLISAGRVATGIVGVIGTARRGPIEQPVALSGFSHARELFGLADPFGQPEDGANPLTLIRALEHIYSNGAASVVAVRVAGPSRANASFAVQDSAGKVVVTLAARTPGTWGNDIRITVDAAEDHARIGRESHTETFDRLQHAPVTPSKENQIRVFRGVTRQVQTFDIVYRRVVEEDVPPDPDGAYVLSTTPVANVAAVNRVQVVDDQGEIAQEYEGADILFGTGPPPDAGELRLNPATGELTFEAGEQPADTDRVHARYAVDHDDPEAGQVLVTTWDGNLDFAAGEAPSQPNGDRLEASYLVDRAGSVEVALRFGPTVERYVVPAGQVLADQVNASPISQVTATADETNGGNLPRTGVDAYFGTGSNVPGGNGAEAGQDEYRAGLDRLANELINIVVLAGQDAGAMGSILLGHLNATEQTDLERIGVIGAPGSTVAEFLGHAMADDRVILVAPGLLVDGAMLPPAYTAAAVAGLISSVPVPTSLTNKVLNLPGLALKANRGEQEQLIRQNVLTVAQKDGFRIIKGLTSEGEGEPFSAIPTRRIVDYAKYGVRSAANPYLGRLNNTRVRAALRATLDAFLTRMVQDEALTQYALEVSATRAQEIAGEVSVVMTLQPTFSIEFIRVVMILR
jgi:Phage tail sheath protein subtilisin-like domain/Phage tail sheath C-terminal domain